MFKRIKVKLKKYLELLPYSIGRLIPLIPNLLFFGKKYTGHVKKIRKYNSLSTQEKKEYLFNQIEQVVKHASNNVDFYRRFYSKFFFNILQLRISKPLKKYL